MAKKHIVGKSEYYELQIGDIVLNKSGKIITGKGKGVCLNRKWANYSGNTVLIQVKTPMGYEKEMRLSKQEIKILLKNFKDSR